MIPKALRASLVILFLTVISSVPAFCQRQTTRPPKTSRFKTEIGNLDSRYDRGSWPSPETVLADLRSESEATRLKAFHLLGAEGEDAYAFMHNKDHDWEEVATPWQSELRYAPLGDDEIQDAIIVVQVRNLIIVAIAVPSGNKWVRIGAFKCLCPSNNDPDSYGTPNGNNLLGTGADIGRFSKQGFERYELILTALEYPIKAEKVISFDQYLQHEAHFRIYAGELHRTIAFERRIHPCASGCVIERRWFYHQSFGDAHTIQGAVLVEAEGITKSSSGAPYGTDLEEQRLRIKSCSESIFNEQTYRFEPYSPSGPTYDDVCTRILATSN